MTTSTDIFLDANSVSVASDHHAKADVTFHCDMSTALFVIFGCLPLADAIPDGRVRVEGKAELATMFEKSFQGG